MSANHWTGSSNYEELVDQCRRESSPVHLFSRFEESGEVPPNPIGIETIGGVDSFGIQFLIFAVMKSIQISLLRGVCQLPGYVAHAKGFFKDSGMDVEVSVAPTAWMIPERLINGEVHFAVMPWTRVVSARVAGEPLVVVCGSGHEEAAIVVRQGIEIDQVRKVAVPQKGGIKDLTAMGLLESMGWNGADLVRMPSGDGAILALVGRGADAASMIEPYATMLEELGLARIVKRTGDLWPGAPGCSLTTTDTMINESPELVRDFVDAFVRGARYAEANPDEAARIAEGYMGIGEEFIMKALESNRPNLRAFENKAAVDNVIGLMLKMKYIDAMPPSAFYNGSFLPEDSLIPRA